MNIEIIAQIIAGIVLGGLLVGVMLVYYAVCGSDYDEGIFE